MRFDAFLGFRAIDALGREKPTDVRRVVGLYFTQVAATVASKGENELITVFTHLAHAVDGGQIFQASSQFRSVLGAVAVDDPSLKFWNRFSKRAGVFNAQSPKQQHRRCGVGRCRVSRLQSNPVPLAERTEVVGSGQPKSSCLLYTSDAADEE